MWSEKAFGVFSERRRLQSGGGEDRNRNRILAEFATASASSESFPVDAKFQVAASGT